LREHDRESGRPVFARRASDGCQGLQSLEIDPSPSPRPEGGRANRTSLIGPARTTPHPLLYAALRTLDRTALRIRHELAQVVAALGAVAGSLVAVVAPPEPGRHRGEDERDEPERNTDPDPVPVMTAIEPPMERH